MNVIGEVRGKRAIIVDDEIDTGGTLVETTKALEREGALEIYGCATHGVLSRPGHRPHPRLGPARRSSSPTPSRCRPRSKLDKIKVLSVAPLIGEAITRIHRGDSVGALFSSRDATHPGDAALGRGRRGSRMTDPSGLQPADGEAKTTLYRPGAGGGLEAGAPEVDDYRDQLRSRRWDAAPLENPEVEKTDPRIAVLALVLLAALTLVRAGGRLRQRDLEPADLGALRRTPRPHPRGVGLERDPLRRFRADRAHRAADAGDDGRDRRDRRRHPGPLPTPLQRVLRGSLRPAGEPPRSTPSSVSAMSSSISSSWTRSPCSPTHTRPWTCSPARASQSLLSMAHDEQLQGLVDRHGIRGRFVLIEGSPSSDSDGNKAARTGAPPPGPGRGPGGHGRHR